MLHHKYIQILALIPAIAFTILGLFCLYYFLRNEVFTIEKDTLLIRSFFGLKTRQFDIREIQYYTDVERTGEYNSWEELDLYFPNQTISIYSSNFSIDDYYDLKKRLTKGKQENKDIELIKSRRSMVVMGIAFIGIGLFIGFESVNQNSRGNITVSNENSLFIQGVISNKIELDVREKKESLTLKLKEYPDFDFLLTSSKMAAFKDKLFIRKKAKGSKVNIRIWKETFSKKITETQKLTFKDKHIHYHNIHVLGLSDQENDYLNMDALNETQKRFHDKANFYILMGLSSFLILVGIGFILARNQR